MLAARIDRATYEYLCEAVRRLPDRPIARIDLAARSITAPDGTSFTFDVSAARADALLRGEDEIAATLALEAEIDSYYAAARVARPWLYFAAPQQ